MPDKPTSKMLYAALLAKFPKAAILREVTIDDEAEIQRYNQYLARRYPRRKLPLDENYQMPESYDPASAVFVRRIDALMFEGKTRTAVEIKVSRADFFRDTAAKRDPWRRYVHRFIYLTPAGLVKPEEVPEGCGLWEYEDGTISSTKRAIVTKVPEDLPASMTKYFAWRAFSAEQKVNRLLAEGKLPRASRRRRRH